MWLPLISRTRLRLVSLSRSRSTSATHGPCGVDDRFGCDGSRRPTAGLPQLRPRARAREIRCGSRSPRRARRHRRVQDDEPGIVHPRVPIERSRALVQRRSDGASFARNARAWQAAAEGEEVIDEGTTSTTRDAVRAGRPRCLGTCEQRELTQHYPAPGWVEHDAEEIWSLPRQRAASPAPGCDGGAGRRRRRRTDRRDRHHQPARDDPLLVAPHGAGARRRDRLAGPAHRRALPR
jgi:hypothetical protein